MEGNRKDDLNAPLFEAAGSFAITMPHPLGNNKITAVTFKIRDISCASCTASIEAALGNLNGVEGVMVSPLCGRAVVKYKPQLLTVKTIKETVEGTGFQVDELLEQDIAVCRLRIKGMACTSCSESAERAISMVDGVKKAVVGLILGEAKVYFDPNVTDSNHIIKTIEDAGFGTDLISSGHDASEVHLKLEGINSPEDLIVIQSSLESVIGVNHIQMHSENKVTICYDPNLTGPRSLIQCIQAAGHGTNFYHANLYTPPARRKAVNELETRMYRNQFFWSCLFSVPVFIFSMVLPMLHPYGKWLDYRIRNMFTVGMLLRWVLCTPVQFIVGWRFYEGAYHALRRKSGNMDVLVALGTNAAYFYSLYIVIKALISDRFEGQDFF